MNTLIESFLFECGVPDPAASDDMRAAYGQFTGLDRRGLSAFRVSPNAVKASWRYSHLPPSAREECWSSIDPARLPRLPCWIEYETGIPESELLRQGWLLEGAEGGGIAATWIFETSTTFGAESRRLTLRFDDGRPRFDLRSGDGRGKDMRWRLYMAEHGSLLIDMLTVLTAPELAAFEPPKVPARRGGVAIGSARMVPPFDQTDKNGVPVTPRDGRPERVVDEVVDAVNAMIGMFLAGRRWFNEPGARARALRGLRDAAAAIGQAQRISLSPALADSVAALAAEERKGMADVRRLLALPFPLFACEWRGVGCGVAGDRFLMLVQSTGEEARSDGHGVLYALSEDHHEIFGHDPERELPQASFRLNIQNPDRPLVEITSSNPQFRVADQAVFERFVTAILTFLTQPKLVVDRHDRQREQRLQAANRARSKRGMAPLGAVRDIHLNLDAPAFRGEGGPAASGNGEGRNGTALHQVRAFWRYRLGQLQVVKSHWRGDPRYGVSARRYTFDIADPGAAPVAMQRAREVSLDVPEEASALHR